MDDSLQLDAAPALRATFDRAGFTESAVSGLLGLSALATDRRLRQDLPLYRSRSVGPGPLATLVRLFVLGEAVSPAAAAEARVDARLLQHCAEGVRSHLQVTPFADRWFAADWTDTNVTEPVMGIAASTRALAQLMIHRPVERVLDLGTGSGVLAVLAAAHAQTVVAVDLNPRAAEFTRFNAALNGVANIDPRIGDLFDPVRGETFDRIVCNPPFVIGPTAGRMHSQAGRPGDDLLRSIVRTAPHYLRPGGFCQVIGNWIVPAGSDGQSRLADWFDGLGCNVWVLHAHTEGAATYARQRIAESTDTQRFDEWMAYYGREGVAAVAFGIITLRKSPHAPPWLRYDKLPEMSGECGPSIERGFAARDFLAGHAADASLLAARVRQADSVQWSAGTGRLQLTGGLMFAGAADANLAEFVARCDGQTTLGDQLAARGVDRQRFLTVVRRLIEVGILEPLAA